MAVKATPSLAKVMKGGSAVKDLSENQAKSALSGALNKLTQASKKAEVAKENVGAGVQAAIENLETAGTLFMGSMAEGYLGEEKLKLGGVDLRFGGLILQGAGLVRIFQGKSDGRHLLATGTGLTLSAVSSLGRQAGQAWAKARAPQPQQPPVQDITPTLTAGEAPREIYLTPEPEPAGQRFVPVRAL